MAGKNLFADDNVDAPVNKGPARNLFDVQPQLSEPVQVAQDVSRDTTVTDLPTQEPEEGQGFVSAVTEDIGERATDIFKRFISAPIETGVVMGAGMITEVAAGLTGLASLPFVDAENAKKNIEAVRSAMATEPPSKAGRALLQDAATVLAPVGEGVTAAQKFIGDPLNEKIGPLAGALGQTTPDALLSVLGLKIPKIRGAKPPKIGRQDKLIINDKPSPEFEASLADAGLEFENLKISTKDIIAKQKPNANPDDVARLARFNEIKAPALKGQITKNFEQRKLEQGLMEAGSEATAEPIRQTMLRQSEAIKEEILNIAGKTAGEVGEPIKEALKARKTQLKSIRTEAYKKLTENANQFDDVKILTDNIAESLPTKAEMREFQVLFPGQAKALDDLMVEFNIEKDVLKREAFTSTAGEVTDLSIANFESFRKRLNNIASTDNTGFISRFTGKVKKSLDDEIDIATSAIESKGGDIGQMAKDARQSNIALKTEFDEKKITSKLIDSVKRGSTQPKIEASKVYQQLMSVGAPVENLERVLDSLRKSKGIGVRAVKEMQGRAVLDLLDSAFSSQSRQVSGTRTFGAGAYSRQFEKMDAKLKVLFKDKPGEYNRLKLVFDVAQDIIPPGGAVPKGSAGFFIDALNKMGVYSIAAKVPGAGAFLEILKRGGEGAVVRRKVSRAIKADPRLRKQAKIINTQYPQLATALGITAFLSEGAKSEKRVK